MAKIHSESAQSANELKAQEFLSTYSFIFFASTASDDDSLFELASRLYDSSQRYDDRYVDVVLTQLYHLLTSSKERDVSTPHTERYQALKLVITDVISARQDMLSTPNRHGLKKTPRKNGKAAAVKKTVHPELLSRIRGIYHPVLNPEIDFKHEKMS